MDSARRYEKRESARRTKIAERRIKLLTLLDVVIRKGSSVLELLPGEDESLLIRRDSLLVLDLGLNVVDGVRGLDLQRDRLAGETGKKRGRGQLDEEEAATVERDSRLDEDLHTTSETQDEVKRRLCADR